jgi:predicted DNA-binding ribbon-helix-helix protein
MPPLRKPPKADGPIHPHPLFDGVELSQKTHIRNIHIGTQRTSMRLEPDFWRALEAIAAIERSTVNAIIQEIDQKRGRSGLSASVRVFAVNYFRVKLGALNGKVMDLH